jgi:hypothetical protein
MDDIELTVQFEGGRVRWKLKRNGLCESSGHNTGCDGYEHDSETAADDFLTELEPFIQAFVTRFIQGEWQGDKIPTETAK